MRWGWKWAGITAVVGLLDVAVRFATDYSMIRVVRAEAVLLLGAALLLWFLRRARPAPTPRQHTIQLAIVASFFLGGLRAALWAGGMPVERANLVIALIGLALIVVGTRRRRGSGSIDRSTG